MVSGIHVSHEPIHSFTMRNDVPFFPSFSYGYSIKTDRLETDVSDFSQKISKTRLIWRLTYAFKFFSRMLKIYNRFKLAAKTGEFFALHQWNFASDNVQCLQQALDNSADQELFNVDISMLNWDAYIKKYIQGIRKYVLKDPVETIPSARKKLYRFEFFICI